MPKVGMEPIRRQQLITATMAAIDEVGLAETTVMRIARHAGVSAGIISHYFGGKDGLLEATMRQILTDLSGAVAMRRHALEDDAPRAHIGAIIEGNFDPLATHPEYPHCLLGIHGPHHGDLYHRPGSRSSVDSPSPA